MHHIDDKKIADILDYSTLADALDRAFRAGGEIPARQQYPVDVPGGNSGHLLLMPAWQTGGKIGVKIVTVFPDNSRQSLATVNASYLLMDAKTGVPDAMMDGNELTRRRTAAASMLAARYLARLDSKHLLMVGTGNMAPHLINAHAANRPIEVVQIWGRNYDKACAVAEQFTGRDFKVKPVEDLEAAVSSADIISCATLSTEALILADWLKPGQHLDLVGAFTPDMREVDDNTLQRADIYVDTLEGALLEAGDLIQALEKGAISKSDIRGDLFGLTRGLCQGRLSDQSITLFKSVGTGLEDLAAAQMVVGKMKNSTE